MVKFTLIAGIILLASSYYIWLRYVDRRTELIRRVTNALIDTEVEPDKRVSNAKRHCMDTRGFTSYAMYMMLNVFSDVLTSKLEEDVKKV